ncbi:hypothetical protein HPB52_004278 [Rhipicephalus sanguineus]|uniref:Uncharacterized protein n=1 Tax=Rhipicephalus sanguineus TaxID=34632 RepID=A0A9D4QHD2_RHISA|nr:hypothetical protein HPB52_004278 [Rhipicephalus sanguineus]
MDEGFSRFCVRNGCDRLQTTDHLWQPQLRRLQAHASQRRQTGALYVPEDIALPDGVRQVLELGSKFAAEATRTKPELLSIVRQATRRAPEDEATRLNFEAPRVVRCSSYSCVLHSDEIRTAKRALKPAQRHLQRHHQ